ncbi:MAG: hypothetical protein KDA83_05015 [Planctomycetales bacterium]|nr:hypothetical protein [Planctomycetales bacterium]
MWNRSIVPRRHPRASNPRAGYSLLEVILATAILAASALMLSSMIANGARAIEVARQRTRGAAIVSSVIDEVIALKQFDSTELEGTVGVDDPWAYRVTMEPIPDVGMLRIIAEAVPAGTDQSNPWNGSTAQTRTIRLVRWTRLPSTESDSTQARAATQFGPMGSQP